jgi:hypothetical protein
VHPNATHPVLRASFKRQRLTSVCYDETPWSDTIMNNFFSGFAKISSLSHSTEVHLFLVISVLNGHSQQRTRIGNRRFDVFIDDKLKILLLCSWGSEDRNWRRGKMGGGGYGGGGNAVAW